DFIKLLFEDFVELHGDRLYGDDAAIVGGLARFEGQGIVVIGHQKGRDTREKIARNFGTPHPEGYRKALRLMQLAEKFGKPVLSLIDTPGAYPGGAHRDWDAAAASLRAALRDQLADLVPKSPETLVAERYEKFRRLGAFEETSTPRDGA